MEPSSDQLNALLSAGSGNGLRRVNAYFWGGRAHTIPQPLSASIVEECRQAGWVAELPDLVRVVGLEWSPVVLTGSGYDAISNAIKPVEYRGCRLEVIWSEGLYRVSIQPKPGAQTRPALTIPFHLRAEAITEAQRLVDKSLA